MCSMYKAKEAYTCSCPPHMPIVVALVIVLSWITDDHLQKQCFWWQGMGRCCYFHHADMCTHRSVVMVVSVFVEHCSHLLHEWQLYQLKKVNNILRKIVLNCFIFLPMISSLLSFFCFPRKKNLFTFVF